MLEPLKNEQAKSAKVIQTQLSSFEINVTGLECTACASNSQSCIGYLKVTKRIDLKSSHHKKKIVTLCGDGCYSSVL